MLKNIVKLTPNAINRLNSIFNTHKNCNNIRLSLKSKGCSGLVYSLELDDDKNKTSRFDETVKLDNNKNLIIDCKSILHLVGTEIDYKNDNIQSQFIFKNPNEKGSCGCGQSVKI